MTAGRLNETKSVIIRSIEQEKQKSIEHFDSKIYSIENETRIPTQ